MAEHRGGGGIRGKVRPTYFRQHTLKSRNADRGKDAVLEKKNREISLF